MIELSSVHQSRLRCYLANIQACQTIIQNSLSEIKSLTCECYVGNIKEETKSAVEDYVWDMLTNNFKLSEEELLAEIDKVLDFHAEQLKRKLNQ